MAKGPGDPDGRKIARRIALQAEDASKLADVLSLRLRKTGLPAADEVAAIAAQLRMLSDEQLNKAEGRVEARLKTRVTGHPLLENRKMNLLFMDESGTSSFKDPNNVFALGGISMLEEDVADYVARADAIKKRHFQRTDITFHEPYMRKHDRDFSFYDPSGSEATTRRRDAFDEDLLQLIAVTPFTLFGVGIRKAEFKSTYIDQVSDPYLPSKVYDLAIMLMIERYVDYVACNTTEKRLGRVHLESIGAQEDAEHQSAFADLVLYGTQYVPPKTFQSWVEVGCRFSPKTGSNPSELADIVAREIYEWTKSDCTKAPKFWDVLTAKIHLRPPGYHGQFGVKVFPADGLEAAIIMHRLKCGAEPQG